MSLWRRVAIETFPQLRQEIADAEALVDVLEMMRSMMDQAYSINPPDDETISKVYGYAESCLNNRHIDIRTEVVIYFYESLPRWPRVRQDMVRWVSDEMFELLTFAWSYVLPNKSDLEAFQHEFRVNKRILEIRATRKKHH